MADENPKPDFVTLTCPSCGGKLKVTNDIDRFACAHCGTEQVVRRGGGIDSPSPVLDKLTEADETVAELAIRQLSEEIADLEAELAKKRSSMEQALAMVIGFFAVGVLCAVFDQLGAAALFGMIGLVAIFGYRSAVLDYRRNQGSSNAVIERKRSELKKHLGVIYK